jgi:hypothetical protein
MRTKEGAMRRRRLAVLVAATLALGGCGGRQEARGTLSEGWLTRNRDAKGPVETPAYAWPLEETHPLQLPGTGLIIDVHDSYFEEEIQEEERRVFQVASFGSADYYVDFDVYLIPKTEAASLADLALTLVEGSRDGREDTHVTDGVEYYTYLSEIAFDGLVYDTITLVTEEADAYVRVVFWLEGDEEEAMAYARQMIASLRPVSAETDGVPETEYGIETGIETEIEPGTEAGTEAAAEADTALAPEADAVSDAAIEPSPDAMPAPGPELGVEVGHDEEAALS